MAKLYPPSIEGKLPAFAGTILKLPITMNRTVALNQVSQMRAMVKTVQTNQLKATLIGALAYEADSGKYYAQFDLNGNNFQPNLGQYYKIQVAYVDYDNEVGYYSTVGVAKYTSYPELSIPSLKGNMFGTGDYTAIYSQENGDVTEKIYSYCFELTDKNGAMVATTGVQLHNSSMDKNTYSSEDSWSVQRELEVDVPYYLIYKVTTMNGLEASSAKYPVVGQDSVDMEQKINLKAKMDFDEGCIQLYWEFPKQLNQDTFYLNGSYLISRASSEDNFITWHEIHKFSCLNEPISYNIDRSIHRKGLWSDCTIQQGVTYLYAIQAYNSYNLYSNRVLSIDDDTPGVNKIYADFEDMFLYDGTRQLKIRFNPKVSSFKSTILETKTNTLGSKYPFIFRNGNVNYKEFPVAGLLSMQSDEKRYFRDGIPTLPDDTLYKAVLREKTPSAVKQSEAGTLLTAEANQREREFKMQVLEWLTNGQPKLFRSPTEGNYIVRLMNSSLTPIDTLGRMIHSFSSTAYEVAEYNIETLTSLGFLNFSTGSTTVLCVGQVNLYNITKNFNQIEYPDFQVTNMDNNKSFYRTILTPSLYNVRITDVTPGTIVGITLADGKGMTIVEIGYTGTYQIQIKDSPLISIQLMSESPHQWREESTMTFSYYDNAPADNFSQISNLTLSDEVQQFIGRDFEKNIITEELEDIRRDIGQFHYLKVEQRQIVDIWEKDGRYYRTSVGLDEVTDWNQTILYRLMENGIIKNYFDYSRAKPLLEVDEVNFKFSINKGDGEEYIDMRGLDIPQTNINESGDPEYKPKFGSTFGRYLIYDIENINSLRMGPGVMAEAVYRVRTKHYVVEETDIQVYEAKALWENALKELNNLMSSGNMTNREYRQAVDGVKAQYKGFVDQLKVSLSKNE